LHLSIFHDWERVTELKEFCELTLDTIKPAAVLVSGMFSYFLSMVYYNYSCIFFYYYLAYKINSKN